MRVQVVSKKFGTREFLIDDEDYWKLAGWTFYLWSTPRHRGIYVNCYSPDDRKTPKRLHRVIMNARCGEIVDHINGDPLDNRKCNLRTVNALVNNQNARKRKDAKSSKYKGVSWHTRSRKWRAQIQMRGKKVSLGYHKTERAAAAAYNKCLNDNGIVGPRNLLEDTREEMSCINN